MSPALHRPAALAMLFCLASLADWNQSFASTLPSASEVLNRLGERAKAVPGQTPRYEFTRTRETRIKDGDGKLESSEQETFRMVPIGNRLYARLITKDGKPLTAEQTARVAEDESRFREKAKVDPKKDGSLFKFLNEETANRFIYQMTGEEMVNGRKTYVLKITPKPNLKTSGIEQKVMARMAGTLWVDAEESEVVRIESKLNDTIRIMLGIGTLYDFQFGVARRRLENGQWANSTIRVNIHFRELFSTKYVDYQEAGSDYLLLTQK